jgi:hypothetical protein
LRHWLALSCREVHERRLARLAALRTEVVQHHDRPGAGQIDPTIAEAHQHGIDVPAHVNEKPGDGPPLGDALRQPFEGRFP